MHRKGHSLTDFAPDAGRIVMQDGDLGSQNRVLTSWKEIASYLGKGVRTVQRWEKDFGLPIRRPIGSDKSAIIARTRDLDAWVALRCSTRSPTDGDAAWNQRIVAIRSSLAAGLTTARMLQETNVTLLSELRQALLSLRTQISRLQTGAHRRLPAGLPTITRSALAAESLGAESLAAESMVAAREDGVVAGAA
jgi:predicted DNA-binding transcriptional regulator AlpA